MPSISSTSSTTFNDISTDEREVFKGPITVAGVEGDCGEAKIAVTYKAQTLDLCEDDERPFWRTKNRSNKVSRISMNCRKGKLESENPITFVKFLENHNDARQ